MASGITEKECVKCRTTKPIDGFYLKKNANNKDYRDSQCTRCRSDFKMERSRETQKYIRAERTEAIRLLQMISDACKYKDGKRHYKYVMEANAFLGRLGREPAIIETEEMG